MAAERAQNTRTLKRYQFMFRTSVSMAALGALLSATGALIWTAGTMPQFLPLALLAVSLGGMCAYKVAASTVALLESEGCFNGR